MLRILKNQQGVSAIVVAVSLAMLIGFAAIAVDGFHLIVVKNELQNAADAGALAGAAALYRDTLGESVSTNANLEAYDGATLNKSERVPVELYNYTNNVCPESPSPDEVEDVQRGHWGFINSSEDHPVAESYFKCNGLTVATDIAAYSFDQLNADDNFINAVKVIARREGREVGTPVLKFFAQIFGQGPLTMSAEAIAYIGFASNETQVGAPIVICKESIKRNPDLSITCNEGRMYNATHDTARWSNLDDCDTQTSAAIVGGLIRCNPADYPYSSTPVLGTMEGQVQSAFDALYDCWLNGVNEIPIPGSDPVATSPVLLDFNDDDIPDQPWSMTLPIIICEGPDALGPTCGKVTGHINIRIVWMATKDTIDSTNPNEPGAPKMMHYEVPNINENQVLVYGDAWPNTKPAYPYQEETAWNYSSPNSEPIHNPSPPNIEEPSLYDIMKQLLTGPELANLEKDILKDHPTWDKLPDSSGNPFWTTKNLGELIDYGEVRWASMVKYFKLQGEEGGYADYEKKTLYFLPNCTEVIPDGHSGFDNWGILAKYPKLVK